MAFSMANVQPQSAANPRLERLLYFAAAAFIAYTVLYVGVWRSLTIPGVDYDKHWQAALALLEGRSVYLGGNLWLGFNYPQATAFPFFWLAFFDIYAGEKVWKLMLLGMLLAAWAVAWRMYRPHRGTVTDPARRAVLEHWGMTAAFVISAYHPATSNLHLGNIDPVNALLAVAMAGAWLRGRERWAGVWWALLTLVKMMPVALVIPVLLCRRWRALQGFLLVMVLYFVLLLATGRIGEEWFFVREIIPAIPRWWRYISYSPMRLVFLLSGNRELYDDPHVFMWAARLSTAILGAAYLAIMLWLWRRRIDFVRVLEVAILAYPFLSPLLEYHHYVYVLPVLLMQVRRWSQGDMSYPYGAAYLAGWVVLQVAYQLSFLFSKWGEWVHFVVLFSHMWLMGVALIELFSTAPRRRTDDGEAR